MTMRWIVLMLPCVSAAATAAPVRVFIAGAVNDGPARLGPVNARRGQRVTLYAVVKRGRYYYGDLPKRRSLRRGRRRISRRSIRPLSRLGPITIRWSQVEPQPHHVATDPPNPGRPAYSNAVLFGPRHGQWLGYDTLEYFETALPERGSSLTLDRVKPTHPRVNVHGGLGTMHFRVQVKVADQLHASPGAEPTIKRGLSPRVMRVSFRAADDLVGYLAAYYNVPNVFGSGGGKSMRHQTELFQGADCADVIIGAARQAGARLPYSSVRGLSRYARPVTGKLVLDEKGLFRVRDGVREPVDLTFGDQIRRGDLMLIDYLGFDGSPRSWDHVAVISADRGRAGRFDPEDLVMHMGYLYGLTEAAAKTEGPAVVQFLRFRRRYAKRWR